MHLSSVFVLRQSRKDVVLCGRKDMFSCGKAGCAKTDAAQPQQKNEHKDALWYNSNILIREFLLYRENCEMFIEHKLVPSSSKIDTSKSDSSAERNKSGNIEYNGPII
jgi:hypothetical protein